MAGRAAELPERRGNGVPGITGTSVLTNRRDVEIGDFPAQKTDNLFMVVICASEDAEHHGY